MHILHFLPFFTQLNSYLPHILLKITSFLLPIWSTLDYEASLLSLCYCVLANSELAQVPLLVVLLILQFCIIKENRTSSFVMKVLSAYEQKNMKLKLSLERDWRKWETVHISKITHWHCAVTKYDAAVAGLRDTAVTPVSEPRCSFAPLNFW